MNRLAMYILSVALAVSAVLPGGCSSRSSAPPAAGVTVVCTTYPIYLFTRNVAADAPGVRVQLLLPPSTGCPHDYTVTPADMDRLSHADVLVANGLGLDAALVAAARRANPKVAVIDSAAGLTAMAQSQPDAEDHRADHADPDADHHHDHGHGTNPHLFANPQHAAGIVRNIAAGLAKADSAHAVGYTRNASAYAAKLNALADEIAAAAPTFANRRVVAEHDVFAYLLDACGLELAGVVEQEPGQEPLPGTMIRLEQTLRDRKVAAILAEPQYPATAARALGRDTGVPVILVDPVATGPDDPSADYYERTMRNNLAILRDTLGQRNH